VQNGQKLANQELKNIINWNTKHAKDVRVGRKKMRARVGVN
jgi:hypothetical protein